MSRGRAISGDEAPLIDQRGRRSLAGVIGNALVGTVLAAAVFLLARWAIFLAAPIWSDPSQCSHSAGACWPFLGAKFRLIMFGRYPFDSQWRPSLVLAITFLLCAWTIRRTLERPERSGPGLLAVWAAGLLVCAILQTGGILGLAYVSPELWDGLPLTVMLAGLGSAGAFWLALLLALGRRSDLPIISAMSAGYIEFIRGIPLVGMLFMVFVLLPLALPPQMQLSSPLRALFVLTLFLAAYMAEVVRGALQNVPKGQYEAAAAIGLGYWRTMGLVILPQALRQAIPSLVNIFISAIKDTSVVLTIGLFDVLGTSEAAIADPAWGGRYLEIYLFVALLYGGLCGVVSWYSRAIETRLGAS